MAGAAAKAGQQKLRSFREARSSLTPPDPNLAEPALSASERRPPMRAPQGHGNPFPPYHQELGELRADELGEKLILRNAHLVV
jgi:hypothetical protein